MVDRWEFLARKCAKISRCTEIGRMRLLQYRHTGLHKSVKNPLKQFIEKIRFVAHTGLHHRIEILF